MLCACFQIWLLGLACLCNNEATGGGAYNTDKKVEAFSAFKKNPLPLTCWEHFIFTSPPKKDRFKKVSKSTLCETL